MKIIYSKTGSDLPFKPPPRKKAMKAYSGDYYGAFSLEKFASASSLSLTHEDAQGWMAYLANFYPANFWYKDGNVQPWAYYEDYDNWQDTYGMDAVLSVYHSGHGGMSAAGVFSAPLGANWGGLGTSVFSDRMRLGNEQANYIFWSTCLSLRVLDGHNPIRTWSPANLGFRMLFGYETTSVDDANYGKYFWQEWCKGKSFSNAFLDASWRISHGQAPSVVACGATRDEARNRVFNERFFEWGHVSTAWWWWRWYYAVRGVRALNKDLPAKPEVAELEPARLDERIVADVVKRYGLEIRLPSTVQATADGIFYVRGRKQCLSFAGDGSFEIRLDDPNLDNFSAIEPDKAVAAAKQAVKLFGLDKDAKLVLDVVRPYSEAGATGKATGEVVGPYSTQIIISFRQIINGLPVVTRGAGEVIVTVDNDGKVTGIASSVRPISRMSVRPKNTTAVPIEGRTIRTLARPLAAAAADYERLLDDAWQSRFTAQYAGVRAAALPIAEPIPDSTEVGYDIRGNDAVLVARRTMEVDFGQGLRKRYQVVVPLLE